MRIPRWRMLAALAGAAAMVLALGAGPALAAGPGERPGNGYGDTINTHEDGPPGATHDLWGWGYGDTQHDHDDGPPGLNLGD